MMCVDVKKKIRRLTMSAMIGVDWGTSSMRVYLIENNGAIAKRLDSDNGILNIKDGNFVSVLLNQMDKLKMMDCSVPLVISGMITSKNGWFETPYIECPASPADLAEGLSVLRHERLGAIWFVPGVRQLDPEADIMRGEETQVAGIDSQGQILVIFPGTHSKWVKLQDNVISRFKTFMTGDLYSAVLNHSILRTLPDAPWSDKSFIRGVQHGYKRCQRGGSVLSGMFQVRVQAVLGLDPAVGCRSFLSGTLIGSEIFEGMKSGFDDHEQVLVAGEKRLGELYLEALAICGIVADDRSLEGTAHGLYRIAKIKGLLK